MVAWGGGGSLLEHFINSRSVFHLKITWFSYPLVFFLRPISHCLLSRKRKKPRNSQVFPFLTYILNCLGQAASSFFPLALYWWGHIHQQRHTLIATERELTSHFLLISAGFNLWNLEEGFFFFFLEGSHVLTCSWHYGAPFLVITVIRIENDGRMLLQRL